MSTERKLFSYDTMEDADIHAFFQSLPQRQASKYIRIALRLLIKQMDREKNTRSPSKTPDSKIKENEKKETPEQANDKDEFVDIDQNFIDLGK